MSDDFAYFGHFVRNTQAMTRDAEVKCLALLLHLSSLMEGWQEGPFKAGFETAIEEAAAYVEHLRAEDPKS